MATLGSLAASIFAGCGMKMAAKGDRRSTEATEAAQYLSRVLSTKTDIEAEVTVETGVLSTPILTVTHAAPTATFSKESSPAVTDEIATIAYWYAHGLDRGIELQDLNGRVVAPADESTLLATWNARRSWAEKYISGQWARSRYTRAVVSTIAV